MNINVNNEYGKLKSVVVSSAAYFDPTTLALNNETIKYYAENGGVPTRDAILKEQEKFWDVLRAMNINVLVAENVDGAKGQMFTRDLAFVIGNKFFISNMRKENRRLAIKGWDKIITKIDPNLVVKVPADIYLEGGDVLVNGRTIYIGISERTNMDGVNFLRGVLGTEYNIIPLKLKPKFLHLDVVFTLISPTVALVYKDGLEEDAYNLLKNKYEIIELTENEQFELGTNVFVVEPNKIIMNANHKRIESILRSMNFDVLTLDMSETAKDGGAFRCTTCPLERM